MKRPGIPLVLSLLFNEIYCLTLDDLFAYGPSVYDKNLDSQLEDGNSAEARLSVPFLFYQREFESVFVNENGLVSFQTDLPSFYNVELPMDYPVIAPFYADVDIRQSGQVYWRVSKEVKDLAKFDSLIKNQFRGEGGFGAKELLVVTWDQVGSFKVEDTKKGSTSYFNSKAHKQKVNTFQLVLGSDGTSSYSMFLYPQDGINWIRGDGKNRGSPDARAQVGFMFLFQDGNYKLLPYSGKQQISNIASWSNCDVPGLWIHKVGRIDPLENIKSPAKFDENQLSSAPDCSLGSTFCHSEATCTDTGAGYCCACNKGWLGNGENCLKDGAPQRVNGRVNGLINGVSIVQQDLHCYVVTSDGRTYTAISRVPQEIGWDLQGLVPLGTAISWLFAFSEDGATNGFSLTGGELNYTAEVEYPDTGHSVSIKLSSKGMNVFDYLTANIEVTGTIPNIPDRAKISVDDNTMHFTKVEPGSVIARSEHKYTIEGTDKVVPYTLSQSARWNECAMETDGTAKTMELLSARNFILYDEKEEIVRYSLTSKISPLHGNQDPCKNNPCGRNSQCLIIGQKFSCECNPGFWMTSDGVCGDIDECLDSASNNCGENAQCLNTQGSFECRCRDGYIGDGFYCYEEKNCDDLDCGANSQCKINRFGQGECACSFGYEMRESTCVIIPSKVNLRSSAQPNNLQLRVQDPHRSSEVGPLVRHTFTLSNMGPFDVGHLAVNLSWPLQDDSDNWLLYLSEAPYIEYSSSNTKQPCLIDENLIDNLKLDMKRRQKRSSEVSMDDLVYAYPEDDKALGAVYDNQDRVAGQEYEFEEYDYSEIVNALLNTAEETPLPNALEDVIEDPANGQSYNQDDNQGFPLASRVMEQEVSAPTYEGNSFGRINFICKVSLAVNEVGVININSNLFQESVKSQYSSVSRVSLDSTAQLLETELIKSNGPTLVEATTIIEVQDPVYRQDPGKGISCGSQECHKYASCTLQFGTKNIQQCKCPSGFNGDGVSSCEPGAPPTTQPTPADCRTDNSCGSNAECLYQAELLSYECKCRPGFYGDGQICANDRFTENSEYPESNNGQAPEPACIFGVCTCGEGFTFNGQSCEKEANPPHAETCQADADCQMHEECSYNRMARTYTCSCKAGYEDSSNGCISNRQDLCSNDQDCEENEACQYAGREQRRICACKLGYLKEMGRCVVSPNAGCDILKNCHQSAECKLNRISRSHECSCIEGYLGNGTNCEKNQVIGCNVLDNCGKFATCNFDEAEKGFRCLCDTARGFTGDGFSCTPAYTCAQNPAVCDPNADCLDPRGVQHGCRCKNNFFGDGLSCEPTPRYEGNFLILAQGMALVKVPFSGRGSKPINVNSKQNAAGVDIDCSRGKVYWTDTNNKVINVANIDGSQPNLFIADGFKVPEGLAVDWVSRNMYVTDPGLDFIEVINLDNKLRHRLIEDKIDSPRGIALHPAIGKIYWTDRDTYNPRIEMANMDGSGRQTLVDFGIGEPNSIAVDYDNYEVCWIDAGRSQWEIKPKISCIGANGSGRRMVTELQEHEYPYGISITHNSILWTDWKKKFVHGVDKNTGVRQKPVPYILAGVGKPYDLVNVPEMCPYLVNSCQGQPCGLNRMCLPDGKGGHTCI